MNAEAVQLCENHPNSADTIQEKAKDLSENWTQLREKSDDRKSKLNDSYIFQKFLSDYRSVMVSLLASFFTVDSLSNSIFKGQRIFFGLEKDLNYRESFVRLLKLKG